MRQFVLLFGDVVGLQCRGRNLDGVGEDLLALLDLLGFVGNGSFSIWVTAWPACVGSKTIPEPNWACAAGWNDVATAMASALRISFLIVLSFR